MSLLLITIAALIGYSKSRYFPIKKGKGYEWINQNKRLTAGIAYVFLIIALVLYCQAFTIFTGFFYWLTAVMLVYSCWVIILPIYTIRKKI